MSQAPDCVYILWQDDEGDPDEHSCLVGIFVSRQAAEARMAKMRATMVEKFSIQREFLATE